MKGKRKVAVAVGLGVALLCSPVYASATPFDKLGRGAANLVTGWLELPVQISRTTESEGSLAGASVGFARGLLFGVGRTALGVLETVTFLLPNHTGEQGPADDPYGPIVEPEFLIFREGDVG